MCVCVCVCLQADSSGNAAGVVDGLYAIGDCSTVSNQMLLKAVATPLKKSLDLAANGY